MDVNKFTGTYSYKTSGDIDVTTDLTTINVPLSKELGTMHIIKDEKGGMYDVKIVMNELGGEIYTAYGNVDGDKITIFSYERPLNINLLTLSNTSPTVICHGKGLLKNGVLVITQDIFCSDDNYTIEGSGITTVAELND